MEEGSELRWVERTGVGICTEDVCMERVFRYENPRCCFLSIMTFEFYVGDICLSCVHQ